MIICSTVTELRKEISAARRAGRCVGFVPTMGNLHAGHGSLITAAASGGDFTVVSIFVNPTQFGPNEDFASYPRTPGQDLALCESLGADVVFMPNVEDIYRAKSLTTVHVAALGESLCGASRPGHFDGVCIVVAKLFNMVAPDKAYFGRKDAQQLAIIRRMVADLDFPIEIIGCDIVREADGLAMSSRNAYLSPQQRSEAVALSGSLAAAAKAVAAGCESVEKLRQTVVDYINSHAPSGEIDYVECVDVDTIAPLSELPAGRDILLAVAVRFTSARLIDNAIIRVP